MTAVQIMIGTLLLLAIGYRYYSAFLAAKVCVLDDARLTPAHRLNDGQNYHPTQKWVLFGHHFAAISGAGPLIGPVLSIQFGYAPGLMWLLIGVVLAGAVQDMLVLSASVRYGGRSLAEIAREAIGPLAGTAASLAIFFIVIVALAGLGLIVVKALGGEAVNQETSTVFTPPAGAKVESVAAGATTRLHFPPNTHVRYTSGAALYRSEDFWIEIPRAAQHPLAEGTTEQPALLEIKQFVLPAGAKENVAGSSWGTFTIACTVPIALLVGLYMYKIRKGKVVEASLLGAAGVLLATVAGNWIPGSPLAPYFSMTRGATIVAICTYGFVASILPVWLLLCPRDYLSSFLKIGTVILLVLGVLFANPQLKAPAFNHVFAAGGPYFPGPVFPFVFICIMCGAISGFHALVSSGTTPKMVGKESHIRTIGYGAMLIEGLVGVIALIAAASLSQGDFWAINTELDKLPAYAKQLSEMGASVDNLPVLQEKVGGESLRGRNSGAVTLAVGMSNILTSAIANVTHAVGLRDLNTDSMIKYWYHFALMFEALFILTTIDTGTRIARFLLHEILGKVYKPLDRVDWLPGAVLCTGLVTVAWGGLIWTGQIGTIWPMFGIANQLLAAIALCVVTSVLFAQGKGKYAAVTIVPMIFVTTTTLTAAALMIRGPFSNKLADGIKLKQWPDIISGAANIGVTCLLIGCFVLILAQAIPQWYAASRRPQRG